MGLFNYLFGESSQVQSLKINSKKRRALWKKLLEEYPQKESLSKFFKFDEVDNAMKHPKELEITLNAIEALIDKELVHIDEEERTEIEIITDLKKLNSRENRNETENLNFILGEKSQKQEAILNLLKKIHEVLKLQLHTLKLIKTNPKNKRDLLLQLFTLIFHSEAMLYGKFTSTRIDEGTKKRIEEIIHAILNEEKYEEAASDVNEIILEKMIAQMRDDTSKNKYRKYAVKIYSNLAEICGAPLPRDEELTLGINKLDALIKNNENELLKIVKKNLPKKTTKEEVELIARAFKKAYEKGAFFELEVLFAT